MTVAVAQSVTFTASSAPDFGKLRVDRVDGALLCGTFTPGTDYELVRPIFDGFAQAVEDYALSFVDIYDQQIAALGIRLADGTPVWDVQIYPDGKASCRLGARGDRNGAH